MNLEIGLKSTILEALIEKITNIQNKTTNNAAIEAFTKIIIDEPESARTAIQLITAKIQSPYEWEALQALYLLESCMPTSTLIQAEIGKFRFLNELIKLVSPKYLGNSTSSVIKSRITSLLKGWSDRYPKETKIKEAFEMLIKQGVVLEDIGKWDHSNVTSTAVSAVRPSPYDEDDEKSKLLQKLLRSNKPNDLKAANHLIKTMVKEKEEKEDLRLILNNAKLLSEMLSNASCNTSSEELELMKELKETCVNMKPTVAFLISSCNKSAKDAVELFELNDILNDTLQLYHETMTSIRKTSTFNVESTPRIQSAPPALLDFSSPIGDVPLLQMTVNSSTPDSDLLSGVVEKHEGTTLDEIFSSSYCSAEIVKKVEPHRTTVESSDPPPTSSTLFQDLDILGKSLLESDSRVTECSNDISKINSTNSTYSSEKPYPTSTSVHQNDPIPSDDDELINGICTEAAPICDTWIDSHLSRKLSEMTNTSSQPEHCYVEPLSDIYVPLVEIETDGSDKIPAFEDATGINVSIQLAKNKPRNDVSVFLVLSCSHKNEPISNFLFQPVVPKDCRLKLQTPSKCNLPPFNPHIPVETIVQVMLIASFKKDYIPLKFVISYIEKDEMKTEMGEVAVLRLG